MSKPHPDWDERAERAVMSNAEAYRLVQEAKDMRALYEASAEREQKLREALGYIANFDDSAMKAAKTLHYDMRGMAREVLNESGKVLPKQVQVHQETREDDKGERCP